MEKISEDIWEEIKSNQMLPFIGSKEPNEGNGYHDLISWQVPSREREYTEKKEIFEGKFTSIYMRDLGLKVRPNLSKKDEFIKGLTLNNCTDNYRNTLNKYFNEGSYMEDSLLRRLGDWGEIFCYRGRLIIEIKGWFDNKSDQFYGFELVQLDSEYCKLDSKYVTYKSPKIDDDGNKKITKVKIPRDKCIIIDFPKEYGGYKGFIKKAKQISKLGSQYDVDYMNPGSSLDYSKNWDKNYNKILSDWGAPNAHIEVTEYYKMISAFKFSRLAILCNKELINGLKSLVSYLNEKLKEDAKIKFNVEGFDLNHFDKMQKEWTEGSLSFKEANKIIQL